MRHCLRLLALLALAACVTDPVPAQTPIPVPYDSVGPVTHDSTIRVTHDSTFRVCCRDSFPPAPPPPPPPPTGTNEPRGGTVVADNDWSGFSTAEPALGASRYGWNRYAPGTVGRWVYDLLAPGDPDVLEVPFAVGGKQGTGPEHLSLTLPKGARQLYLSVPVYVPPGYPGSSSGVQKLFHLWAPLDTKPGTPGGSLAVPAIYGLDANPLRTQIRIQGATVTSTQATSFNVEGKGIQRGHWYVTEWLFVLNAPGKADGTATMWQDGQRAAHRTGIMYSKAGCATAPGPCSGWTVVQLNPTYGGKIGTTIPPGVSLRYGRIRVVVAP